MERTDRDPESDHEDHDNPTFTSKKENGQCFPFFREIRSECFIEKPFKDQIEEK